MARVTSIARNAVLLVVFAASCLFIISKIRERPPQPSFLTSSSGDSPHSNAVSTLAEHWTRLTYNAHGWDCVLVVNGIPLRTGGGAASFPVPGGYERPGKNTITLYAKRIKDDAGDIDVTVSRSDGTGSAAKIAELSKSADDAGSGGSWSVDYDGRPDAHWAFANADGVAQLTDADRDAIRGQIRDLSHAVQRGDIDAMLAAFSFSITAMSEGANPADVREFDRSNYAAIFAPHPAVEARDPATLVYRECEQGVIVSCPQSPPDNWIIRAANPSGIPGNKSFTLRQFVFCKIGGHWTIVQ
jgi:hypothetical protein